MSENWPGTADPQTAAPARDSWAGWPPLGSVPRPPVGPRGPVVSAYLQPPDYGGSSGGYRPPLASSVPVPPAEPVWLPTHHAAAWPTAVAPRDRQPGPWTPAPAPPWAPAPHSGYRARAVRSGPAPRSVHGLGQATIGLLVVWMLVAGGQIAAMIHQRVLVGRIASTPGSVSLAQANSADRLVHTLAGVELAALLVTGLVFLAWFFQARTNVERWGGTHQRHGRGWAIGGWICPVVSLWFPFQITRDLFADSEPGSGRYRGGPLVGWWWTAILVQAAIWTILDRSFTNVTSVSQLSDRILLQIVAQLMTLLVAGLTIQVVGRLSALQGYRRRRDFGLGYR